MRFSWRRANSKKQPRSPSAAVIERLIFRVSTQPNRRGQRPRLRRWRFSEPDGDGLGLRVMLHHFLAHLAAPAGLLVAAERSSGVAVIMGVDAPRAGADLARHHVSRLQVPGPDAGGEAIFGVVGEFRPGG